MRIIWFLMELNYVKVVLISFLLGFIFAAFGTNFSIMIARSLNILDFPGKIKIHREPTPRFGGLGIVIGMLLVFFAVALMDHFFKNYISILTGGLLMAFTGAIDDIYSIKPVNKLLGQFLSGITFSGLFFATLKTPTLSWVIFLSYAGISILFICFMSNSLNLLDGMDGLAAGMTTIIAIFLMTLTFYEGRLDLGILVAALLGSCLGFLFYNISPAKTFMGDIGSLFLGYIIAVVAIDLAFIPLISVNRLLGILLILALPIADTCLAILRRIIGHKDIFSGDRFHLYDCIYRLVDKSIWKTLGIMWAITLICGLLGLVAFFSNTFVAIAISVIVALGMLILAVRTGAFIIPLQESGKSNTDVSI